MNNVKKNKIMLVSVLLILFGLLCLTLQATLYGDIDANGVVQDSWFIPLGMFTLLLGVILAFILIFKRLVTFLLHKYFHQNQP